MFDAKKLLDQFLGSQMPGTNGSVRKGASDVVGLAKSNPLATGAIAAVLLGSKTGRNLAGNAVKLGGLAVIAGLGYQAYKNYQAGQAPEPTQSLPELLPPPSDSPFSPEAAIQSEDFALALVRAMIAAAKADGHIDDSERSRIMHKVHLSGIGSEAEAFIRTELANPTDLDAMVSAARTEEQKVELYTASRLAIDPDTRAERGYLDMLAGRLGLADALVDHIEATVSAAKVQA
ncbi:tellurite resistance TerB family protein [Rhizobium sp. SL42]|uniref:tellurite resistance TerB family protein n=1 Tax=Rhizobium sp. SL42 TaxID=2806346 RepID=UPI001F438AC3|nr:tellurite resistance TerB family protein [Rhizobium sp. SL42]UJW74699.1 tellurite resistance TerB family protein [Rhizobium sp. SL42]